jgi:hypothetical protein
MEAPLNLDRANREELIEMIGRHEQVSDQDQGFTRRRAEWASQQTSLVGPRERVGAFWGWRFSA